METHKHQLNRYVSQSQNINEIIAKQSYALDDCRLLGKGEIENNWRQ
jgi:hypothetical protein